MLKKKMTTTFRAALKLIAAEDIKALRFLRRSITNRTSKSISMPKKS
ncbi:MAG: hypothetical protein JXM79_21460 [Sedimentisphaerales bacterium]|nr:hypothetical protein [Sedimentisphaerales bacterium]